MANDMTDSDMAGTTISRHVGELESITTEQYICMARQPTVIRHVCEANHGKSKVIGCMDH